MGAQLSKLQDQAHQLVHHHEKDPLSFLASTKFSEVIGKQKVRKIKDTCTVEEALAVLNGTSAVEEMSHPILGAPVFSEKFATDLG